ELADRPFDLPRFRPNRPRYPVEGAELVENGPLDPVDGVRLELEPALEIELVDGVDQPEDPVGSEVVLVDAPRQPGSHSSCHELDLGRIAEDETLPDLRVAGLFEPPPKIVDVRGLIASHAIGHVVFASRLAGAGSVGRADRSHADR